MNLNRKFEFIIILLVVIFIGFLALHQAQAQAFNIWEGLDETNGCLDQGNCDLESGERFFVNLAKIILRYLGLAALVVFILGGITWITSAGNPDRVRQGKTAVVGAATGLLIVVFSYVIIYNLIDFLGATNDNPFKNAGTCFEKWDPCDPISSGQWTSDCRGDEVRIAQQKLSIYKCGDQTDGSLSVDGCFGPKTRQALQNFQLKNPNCQKNDGYMDATTYAILTSINPGPIPCQP